MVNCTAESLCHMSGQFYVVSHVFHLSSNDCLNSLQTECMWPVQDWPGFEAVSRGVS